LASVPTVGFTLDWHFATSTATLGGLSPVLDNLIKNDRPQFSVNQQDAFATTFITEDGFQYTVEPSKVVIAFQHRMRAKAVSGGKPVMEMLSHPLPFTDLLPNVTKKLIDTTLLVPNAKTRKIHRVGIVSTTTVDMEEVPPGIGRFISYLGKPWNQTLENFSVQIVVDIDKGEKWTDKCVHTFVKPENPEELLTIIIDWQRHFKSGQDISEESLKKILKHAETGALTYFEDLAEGSRFEDEIVSQTA
jgi:hypothetical protein